MIVELRVANIDISCIQCTLRGGSQMKRYRWLDILLQMLDVRACATDVSSQGFNPKASNRPTCDREQRSLSRANHRLGGTLRRVLASTISSPTILRT